MWIYEYDTWPNFTWDMRVLGSPLAEVRYLQGKLLGKMESMGFDLRRQASLEIMTSDAVKTSLIEGENLNVEEVRSSVARKLGVEYSGMVNASRDVEGIVDVLSDATSNPNFPLTKERLFSWHAALFPTGGSGLQKINVATWRSDLKGPMRVVSGPFGKEKVHFQAPEADSLDREMGLFLKWFNTNNDIDSVLKVGVAHLWFVTIHPFEDGNGRIGRAIADMALSRADETSERFYSLSDQIESEKKDYYSQLEFQQRSDPNITEWLLWFLSCLKRAIQKSDIALEKVFYKANFWKKNNEHNLNERQKLILNRMMEGNFEGYMHTSKYAKLAKCSNDTALRDIQELKRLGALVQNPGKGRSTSYRLPDKLYLR